MLFLAATESNAHDHLKARPLAAEAADTVLTDSFALNRPPDSPVRTLSNSRAAEAENDLWRHYPDLLPRQIIESLEQFSK